MCNTTLERALQEILHGIDISTDYSDTQLVRDFMDFASDFVPMLSTRAYYELARYKPIWIDEDLLNYSLYGVSALKV